jgi:Family of unknown function (DUF6191)
MTSGRSSAAAASVRLHATGPEFEGWLSNHGPMAAEAMAHHGHAAEVGPWLDGYMRKLEEFPRGSGAVGADWAEARRGRERQERCRRWPDVAVLIFMTLPGLVIGLIALATVDRLGWWLGKRLGLPWHRDGRRPATAVGFDEVHAIFQPGKRNAIEQRRLEHVLADDDQQGAPPRVRVDLDQGIAIIRAGAPGPVNT